MKFKFNYYSRTCLDCKHCILESGWVGTDITPGDPFEGTCSKGLWGEPDMFHPYKNTEDFRDFLYTARECDKFEVADFITESKNKDE